MTIPFVVVIEKKKLFQAFFASDGQGPEKVIFSAHVCSFSEIQLLLFLCELSFR